MMMQNRALRSIALFALVVLCFERAMADNVFDPGAKEPYLKDVLVLAIDQQRHVISFVGVSDLSMPEPKVGQVTSYGEGTCHECRFEKSPKVRRHAMIERIRSALPVATVVDNVGRTTELMAVSYVEGVPHGYGLVDLGHPGGLRQTSRDLPFEGTSPIPLDQILRIAAVNDQFTVSLRDGRTLSGVPAPTRVTGIPLLAMLLGFKEDPSTATGFAEVALAFTDFRTVTFASRSTR